MEFVFHALAVDEYRRTFGPTMFFMPKTGEKRTYNHVRAGKSEGIRPVLGRVIPGSSSVTILTLN